MPETDLRRRRAANRLNRHWRRWLRSGLYINGTIQAPPGYTLPANAQGTF